MNNTLLLKIWRLRRRLWAKPLLYAVLAVLAAFAANGADLVDLADLLPDIDEATIEKLLTVISSTMLAVATFAVGSMIAAYRAAASSGTPRAVVLVLEDDLSQTALSSFVGAFIFSIVALVAIKTELYGIEGRFALFAIILLIFAWVVLTFVRWVDNIARLGHLSTTIKSAETAANRCLQRRRNHPAMGGVLRTKTTAVQNGTHICAPTIGYLQYVDLRRLNAIAVERDTYIELVALPGAFLTPDKPLALLGPSPHAHDPEIAGRIIATTLIGDTRTFEEDPRFGIVVLSEIAARALSPAVNDPGTAISIITSMMRLLYTWADPKDLPDAQTKFPRVIVPKLEAADLFDDAFTPLARDGADMVEVGIALQNAFTSLASLPDADLKKACQNHAELALTRAHLAMSLPEDFARLTKAATLVRPKTKGH